MTTSGGTDPAGPTVAAARPAVAATGLSAPVVLDTMPRAVIAATPAGEITTWNRAAEELFGWSASEAIGRTTDELLIPAHERENAEAVRAQVRDGSTWTGDFTLMHRDGHALQVRVTNTSILDDRGDVVGVIGVSEDVSQQRLRQQRSDESAEALRVALDVGGLGTWRWDLASGQTEWDTKLQELYGLRPGMLSGTLDQWYSSLHREDRADVMSALERAVETKGSYEVEHRVVWPDGSVHWLQGKGQMILDDSGTVIGAIGCSSEVTEQVELSRERDRVASASAAAAETERIARERLEFLGEINDALASATTHREAMANVTRVAVPRLGDWCTIFVLPESGSRIPDVERAYSDPELGRLAARLQAHTPYDPDEPSMIQRVMTTGETEFYPVLDMTLIAGASDPGQTQRLVETLSLRSVIAVALVKRDRVLGVMQFVNSRESRTYTTDDVVLAEVIASRIASALDNLRLREHEQMIARTLQASLLPHSLPRIDRLDVAVRYWATGEGTEVGGDFYDVFSVDGSWAVVIGDVCGTGPIAASTTGLARHTLRASAWHGASARDVLGELNHAMLRSGHSTFCTVAYNTLTPTDDGFALESTAGGHPLPVLCRASGEVELVGVPGTLIGILEDVKVHPAQLALRPGDTVVLYTDGITDVRPPDDINLTQLQEMVRRSCDGSASADDVADRLRGHIESVLPLAERDDDIALLVFRVTE